jgi:MtN3 and saliva related transmembrane protein
MTTTDELGYVAAMLTTIAFLPQAWLTWKTRSTEGVSLPMYLLFSSGILLWGLYGLRIHSWPVVVANALTLVQAVFILAMKLGLRPTPRLVAAGR